MYVCVCSVVHEGGMRKVGGERGEGEGEERGYKDTDYGIDS